MINATKTSGDKKDVHFRKIVLQPIEFSIQKLAEFLTCVELCNIFQSIISRLKVKGEQLVLK